MNIKDTIEEYLSVLKYINWDEGSIISKADEVSLVKAIYEFVRDEIKHSWDAQDKRVIKSATEVLEQGVGICWAKANLPAALLRACGIPACICYQRLTLGDVSEKLDFEGERLVGKYEHCHVEKEFKGNQHADKK